MQECINRDIYNGYTSPKSVLHCWRFNQITTTLYEKTYQIESYRRLIGCH